MKPAANDVLKGRGVPIQNHPGNQYLRKVVADRRAQYAIMTKSADKEAVAVQVLKQIQSRTPPGRFLGKNEEDGSYYLLDRKEALNKIKQLFREDLDRKKSGDETQKKKSSSSEAKAAKKVSKFSKPGDNGKPSSKGGGNIGGKDTAKADIE